MGTNKLKGFISDEEMAKLESSETMPIGFVSDDEMAQMENPGYLKRVSSGFDKALSENIERQKGGANPIISTARTLTEAPQIAVSEIPGVKPLGKAIGTVYGKGFETLGKGYQKLPPIVKKGVDLTGIPAVIKAIPGAIEKGNEVLPQTAKDALVATTNIAGYIPAVKGVRMAEQGTKSALLKTGEGMESAANRIQGTKVKINAPEQRSGAKNELYGKYEVFGDAAKVQSQWHEKISTAAQKLKDKINSVKFDPADPDTRINMVQVVNRAINKSSGGTRLNKNAVARISKDVKNELVTTYGLDFSKAPAIANNIDLSEAQMLKREVGKYGDWLEHNGKLTANQDATNKASFYNALYDELKKELENKGPDGIREINKQLSEMIPMERAASKQVLIQNRKNPISLDDYIGGLAVAGSAASGNFAPALLTGLNVASKSPSVAKGLNRTGNMLTKLGNFIK